MKRISPLPGAPRIRSSSPPSLATDAAALLAEADHRIANNLALVVGLVRMHSRQLSRGEGPIERDDVKRLLDDVAGRIQTVGKLHSLLAHAAAHQTLELHDYLPGIFQSVASSVAAEGKASLTSDIAPGCAVPPEAALSLGLVFCELVTNSIKYAHPSGLPVAIAISCWRAEDGRVVFEYADDGVGLPEGFDPMVDGSIGLLLVRNRAEQLNADYRFDDHGLGLRFSLTIPMGQRQLSAAE